MPVRVKEYVVSYKAVTRELKKTKKALLKIQKKLDPTGQTDINLQIQAIDTLIAQCTDGKMTHKYVGP